MKRMRRVLAMIIAICMVAVMLPNVSLAADGMVDAAIFASDVHGSTSDLKSVLGGIKTSGIKYSTLGLVGDTFTDTAGKMADITSAAQSALGDNSIETLFGWGDHDGASDIPEFTGLLYGDGDKENYYVYTISMDSMDDDSNISKADVEADLAAFTKWAKDADKSKPLFIMSHMPLHDRRNDNKYANDWYEVITAVADEMDVVFFWAHNHTGESSVDRDAFYVAKNGTETMTIEGRSGAVVPNFTYMHAGYINANNQNDTVRKNVATTVVIYKDKMVFQEYNSKGANTSGYINNIEVPRIQPEKTVVSIDVTGTTEYAVGAELNLKVIATYDDNTTEDVTAEATFTPATLTASGTYTITASYGDKTDTIEVNVNLYDEDQNNIVSVEVFSPGATGLQVTWDDAAEEILSNQGVYTDFVVYNVDITNPAESSTYAMSLVDEMSLPNLVVYHVAEDGTLTQIEHKIENDCVVFTTDLTGTFAYGSIAIPDGYTLSTITLRKIPTNLFVGTSLDLTNAVITAIYTKEGAEDFICNLTIYDTDNCWSGYDVNQLGAQTAVFTYEGVSVELPIYVWRGTFAVGNVKVEMGDGGFGVTDIAVVPSINPHLATALQYAIVEGTYVAYDITLSYAKGYEENDSLKTVTMPIPEGVTDPVVYYVSANGTPVEMKTVNNGDGTASFITTHFSTYAIGQRATIDTESQDAVVEGTPGTTKTVYVLSSSVPTAGKQYLIVSSNSAGNAYALKENTTTGTSVKINAAGSGISAVYIETTDESIMWNVSAGITFTSVKSGYRLGHNGNSSGLKFVASTEGNPSNITWTVGATSAKNSNGRYLRYDDGWSTSSWTRTVYFYEKQEITVSAGAPGHTYSVIGTDMSVVALNGATVDLSSTLMDTPTDTNTAVDITSSSEWTVTYKVVDTKGNPNVISSIQNGVATLSGTAGTAVVKVTYTNGSLVAWDEFTVTTGTVDHYKIQLHKAEMTVATGVTSSNVTNYYVFNATEGTYEKATSYTEGATYYTTPVIAGAEIKNTVILKGVKGGEQYAVWAIVKAYVDNADTTGVDIGRLGDDLTWTVSDESIATINKDTGVITFTGTNYGNIDITVSYEGNDGRTIEDTITLSVTDTLYTVPGDGTNDFPEYPSQGAVRFDKTATAVGNFSETGLALVELSMTGVPYQTGAAIDALLMLDMSTSMKVEVSDDHTRKTITVAAANKFVESIVKNADGTYNNNKVAVAYFNGSTVTYVTGTGKEGTGAYVSIANDAALTTLQTAISGIATKSLNSSGTYYGEANESAWTTMQAQDKVSDSKQAYVFMSDGGPTQYTYVNGNSYATAAQDSASTIVGWFDKNTTAGTAVPNSNFKTEYYTYKMKEVGYPVYTVGLGLAKNSSGPNAYTSLNSKVHEALTSYILTSMATSGDYFYNIADEDAVTSMGNIFASIAASIKEAAKDVVVEDKIGSKYSLNVSLPGYNTSNQLDPNALDGLSNFYIQVVDYTLDATTHERTDVYKVKEKFTFNLNGTLASHTIGDTVCTDCDHVKLTNGEITSIDGTYFDYLKDSTGEYLTWTEEKLSETELALQFFAHLDNSSGVATDDQVDPGTYYTNDYGNLTYTNVNGNRVQQEFPVPQMTWYGAQVSYVFYLVNAQGQPVNRAGRVVPFAEAVFVTDVSTYSIVWNDLEQAASLDVSYLAEGLVPDVYMIYDNDASYSIHVYADEDGANLNNHFIIGGNVADEWNTKNGWTNSNTTYVFNNKSDGTKYYAYGAYIANDGIDSTSATKYLCKGVNEVTGVAWTEVTLSSDSDLVTVPYYYDVNGVKTRALTYVEGTTYYKLTAANYSAAAGETHWTPGSGDSTTGGTVINNHVYYVDEAGKVYTIVQKSNGSEVRTGFDFANTTVAFAVVWKPELVEDTVVIDYGLDVIIDVTANDTLSSGIVGITTSAPNGVEMNKGAYTVDPNSVSTSISNDLWTATVENLNDIRFHMNKMGISEPIVFYYETEVTYYKTVNGNTTPVTENMYSQVTVIPATSIYYEDTTTYVSYTGDWKVDGPVNSSATQNTDRPGINYIDATYDANNVYGYDSAYVNTTTHSLGSAHKVTVNASNTSWPTATFTFTGTGFEILGTTSNTTGTITVDVESAATGADGNPAYTANWAVDTFYGYQSTQNGYLKTGFKLGTDKIYHKVSQEVVAEAGQDGEVDGILYRYTPNRIWTATTGTDNSLYQIPVIKKTGMDYGTYTVTITVRYIDELDHTGKGSYDFYLDGIRVYEPANRPTSGVVSDAYLTDDEAYPTWIELRQQLIAANAFGSSTNKVNGAVFIDALGATTSISDYTNFGPNNEVYLVEGQGIAFSVSDTNAALFAKAYLGLKSPTGTEVKVKVARLTATKVDNTTTYAVAKEMVISTSSTSELYYDISDVVNFATGATSDMIIITNMDGDNMASLTNLRLTHKVATGRSIPGNVATVEITEEQANVASDYVTERYLGFASGVYTVEGTMDIITDFIEEQPPIVDNIGEQIPNKDPEFGITIETIIDPNKTPDVDKVWPNLQQAVVSTGINTEKLLMMVGAASAAAAILILLGVRKVRGR